MFLLWEFDGYAHPPSFVFTFVYYKQGMIWDVTIWAYRDVSPGWRGTIFFPHSYGRSQIQPTSCMENTQGLLGIYPPVNQHSHRKCSSFLVNTINMVDFPLLC